MIILGIDPGYVNIAYTVFDSSTKKVLKSAKVEGRKLKSVYDNFEQLLLEFKIDALHIESQYCHPRNQSVYSKTLERNGIILLLCELNNIEVKSITPTSLKKKITGNGKADKNDIIKIVSPYFEGKSFDNHQADSLALCLIA